MRYLASLVFILFALSNPAPTQAELAAPSLPQVVEIYTIPGCFGCGSAKSKFEDRGIPYIEISLKGRPDLYRQMKERVYSQMEQSTRRSMEESMTVPRIFIKGKYIGAYGDLDDAKLDKLAAQLQSNSTTTANQPSKNDES